MTKDNIKYQHVLPWLFLYKFLRFSMDDDVEYPKQRPRIDTTRAKPSTKYTTALQIKTALETDNPDTLTQGGYPIFAANHSNNDQ